MINMAYKRHAQGGRFKAANFGDLGLRALKEQQDRQIRGLKDQNQQDQVYSRQHLQRLEGNAAKEIQHNRELQNFYNKRDNLAIENTEIRGKREVEALMGEAKEYEKQAKFWKDFSTTYSQQYIKAAGNIYDIATTAQSNREMEVLYHDKDHQKFSQGASKLNNLADHEGLKIQRKAWEDYNKGKISKNELYDIVGHVSEISLRINKKTKKASLQKELNESDTEVRNLKALANEKKIPWTAETARQLMFLRKMELMRYYGVDPGSEIGRNFLDGWAKKEYDVIKPLDDIAEANGYMKTGGELNEQTENLIAPVQFLNSTPAKKKKGFITATGDNFIDYNSTFQARVNHEAFTSRTNSNGEVVSGSDNRHYAFIQIMESDIASGRFVSKEQAKNHTILQPHPDSDRHFHDDGKTMTYPIKQTWLGRHGNAADSEGKTLEDKFDDAWAAYEKKTATEFKNKKAGDDLKAQIDIDRRAKLKPDDENYLNLRDPKVINELIKTHAGKDDTIEMLQKYRLFAPHNTKEDVVTAALTDLYNKGKLKELSEYTQYLSEPMQKVWESKVEQLAILDRNGYTGTKLTKKAEEYLTDILGSESTTQGRQIEWAKFIRVIKADILNTFDEVYDGGGQRDQDYIEALDAKIKDKMELGKAGTIIGKGVWRRTSIGEPKTKFFIVEDEDDPNPTVTEEELNNTIKGNLQQLDNLFDSMTDGQVQVNKGDGEVTRHLIPIDEIDGAIRDINTGGQIKSNKIVETLWKRQPLIDNKRKYTRADIWNKVFENLGLDIKMPQGSIEKGNWEIENSPFKVTRNLSAAGTEVAGVLAGLVNDNVINLDEPSVESIKINEQKKVRLFFLDRLHQSGILNLSAYGY